MRGDGGVAGEGKVVGVPKFHSWGKCTMAFTNINSDWMSKPDLYHYVSEDPYIPMIPVS